MTFDRVPVVEHALDDYLAGGRPPRPSSLA